MASAETKKILHSLGINEATDVSLPLLEHIVDCVAALSEVVNEQCSSPDSFKATAGKTYGSYMSKVLTNSLGRAVSQIVTSDFTAENAGNTTNDTPSSSDSAYKSKQAIEGYHKLSSRILSKFPNFSKVKGVKGEKMLIHHAAFKYAAASEGGEDLASKNFDILLKASPEGAKELDSMGATALHWATRNANMTTQVVETLIAANPQAPQTRDKSGYLPLHWAVCQDKPSFEMVKLLVNSFPQGLLMACAEETLPIHWLVSRSSPNLEVLRLLVDSNRRTLEMKSKEGNLPIHCCVDRESACVETCQILIDGYPEGLETANNEGHLPLHLAIDHDKPNSETIKILLSVNPASAGIADTHGHLPLHCLLDNPTPDYLLCELVLEAYPSAAQTLTEEGLYPVHILTNICEDPSPHFVTELLNKYPAAVRHEVIDSIPIDENANIHVWQGEWKEIRWTPFGRATERNLRKIVPILRAARFKAICKSNSNNDNIGGIRKTVGGGGRGGSLSPDKSGSPSKGGAASPSLKNSMEKIQSGSKQGSPAIARHFEGESG